MTQSARYELRNGQGDYVGTFVGNARSWQTGDVFTTGDGRVLRVVAVAAVPERLPGRPDYSGGLIVAPGDRTS